MRRSFVGPALLQALLVLLLVLPWINPFAGGPTPSVMPRLVAYACGVLFLLVFLMSRSTPLPAIHAKALLMAALVSSVIGLLQYFGASTQVAPWVNVAGPGYAFGNLRQKNQLASLLNIGLVALVWMAAMRQTRVTDGQAGFSDRNRAAPHQQLAWGNGLSMLAVVLLASASVATVSRTGLLQLLSLLALALVWRRQTTPQTWAILGGAALVYAAASMLLPLLAGMDPFAAGISMRFSDGEQSCQSRIILWQNVSHLIAQKPWFGWGWGELDYAHFITVYPGERFCAILDNAHNLPLHLAVELGIPLAVAVCGLSVWCVLHACPWRETDPDRQLAWAVLLMIGLHSLLEYPLWYGPFQIATVLAIWTLCGTRPQTVKQVAVGTDDRALDSLRSRRSNSWVMWSPLVATLLMVGLTYAAWDYYRVGQVYKAPALRSSDYREDTLRKVQDSWLFSSQVRFATLTLSTVTPENAADIHAMARQLLHFSPEARVVEKLIDSALVLGRDNEARYYMLRYRSAFPLEYARWQQRAEYGPLPAITPR